MAPAAKPNHVDSPDRIAIGLGDGKIDLYNFDRHACTLIRHNGFKAGDMPSFLAFEGKYCVHCVNEESSHLSSFSVSQSGELVSLGQVECEGGPAYLTIDQQRGLAFAANYGGGTVKVFPVHAHQGLGAATQSLDIGVYPHSAVIDPQGRFLYVPAKGSDLIAQFSIGAGPQPLTALQPAAVQTASGAGPRHMSFHPKFDVVYSSNELDSTIDVWAHDAATGQLSRLQTLSSLPAGIDGANNTGSDIHVRADGRFVYASNRGHDSIAVFEVLDEGRRLQLIDTTATGGRVPRNFALDQRGEVLLAANQEGRSISCYSIDRNSGALDLKNQITLDDRPFWVGFWGP